MKRLILALLSFLIFISPVYPAAAQGETENNPVKLTQTVSDGRVAYMPVFFEILDSDAQRRFGVYPMTDDEKLRARYQSSEFSVILLAVYGMCIDLTDCIDAPTGFEIVDGNRIVSFAGSPLGCLYCEEEWDLPPQGKGYYMVFLVRNPENMRFIYVSYDVGDIWFEVFDWEAAKQYMLSKGEEIDSTLSYLIEGPIIEPTPTPIADESSSPGVTAVVATTGNVNLRACPATTCAVVGTLSPGQTVHVLFQEQDWYLVQLPAGALGYIYAPLLRLSDVADLSGLSTITPSSRPTHTSLPPSSTPNVAVTMAGSQVHSQGITATPQSEHIQISAEDMVIEIERFEIWPSAGSKKPDNDVFIVLLATLYNGKNTRECTRARSVRLYLDGKEYKPQNDVMDAVKETIDPQRDFMGAYSGHCIDAGSAEPTFVAFDAPNDFSEIEVAFKGKRALLSSDVLDALANDTPLPAALTATTTLWTPTPTFPTQTSSQSDIQSKATRIARQLLGTVESVQVISDSSGGAVIIKYEVSEFADLDLINWSTVETICDLRNAGFTSHTFRISAFVPVVDRYGVVSRVNGLMVVVNPSTAARINCDNTVDVDLKFVADAYDLHPVMR